MQQAAALPVAPRHLALCREFPETAGVLETDEPEEVAAEAASVSEQAGAQSRDRGEVG